MAASTLSAAAEAGDGAADVEGRTALVDEGGAGDVGEVGAEEVSVTCGVACREWAAVCGDEPAVCGDEAAVRGGVGRIDVESAPAGPPVAMCTAINATARTTPAAATARYARRGAQALGRARWRGI
jgi:hypothetical protein